MLLLALSAMLLQRKHRAVRPAPIEVPRAQSHNADVSAGGSRGRRREEAACHKEDPGGGGAPPPASLIHEDEPEGPIDPRLEPRRPRKKGRRRHEKRSALEEREACMPTASKDAAATFDEDPEL